MTKFEHLKWRIKRYVDNLKSREWRMGFIYRFKLNLGLAERIYGNCPNCGSCKYTCYGSHDGESWECECKNCGYYTED